jgi:hypothetical protein
MYERRWHRWAAPVGVALTTTAGAAYLRPDHHEHAFLTPGHTYAQLVPEFGGGTATAAPLRVVAGYATNAGSATVAPPPPNLRGSL